MALPQYKTLGELRSELAVNLGYDPEPQSGQAAFLTSILQRSQVQLYSRLTGWTREVTDFEFPTVADVWRYAWPARCDPDRVEYVYVRRQQDDVLIVREGFEVAHYDLRDDYKSWPTRYRRRDMFEVWPTPDGVYTMIIGAQERLGAFVVDSDRATVPDDIVLDQALILAYQRQGRPFPSETKMAVERRINELRSRSHKPVYLSGPSVVPWPRPIIGGGTP